MKKLLLIILSIPSLAFAQWQEASTIGVQVGNSKGPVGIYFNSYAAPQINAGVWHVVDVSEFGVPASAKAVMLSGILIITHGTTEQTCDMTISLRAYSDSLDAGNYMGQVVETKVGSGQRSGFSSWTPVNAGRFEWQWRRSTQGQWPSQCAYGGNLSLQAYIK